jgi:hypothetical protein
MSRIQQTTRVRLRQSAMAVGVVFLVAGVAGFIPGLTTDLHLLRFAGHHPGARLLGVFDVSVLHNLVHIASVPPGWRCPARPRALVPT